MQELLDQLELLCRSPSRTESSRLAVYRLLHSLKSWATLQQYSEIELLCHNLETEVGQQGFLAEKAVTDIREELPGLRNSLLSNSLTPNFLPEPGHKESLRTLVANELVLDMRKSARLRDLRAEGKEVRLVTIWISPGEQMPSARMLLLQTILEDHILIHAECWLWNDAGPAGPFDITALGGETKKSSFLGGGVFRCLYAEGADSPISTGQLFIDQVETIYSTVVPPSRVVQCNYSDGSFDLSPLLRKDLAAQKLFLHLEHFVPGSRGMSVNAYLSYESSWKDQIAALHDTQAFDAPGYLSRIVSQSSTLPDRSVDGQKSRVEWRLFAESLYLNEHVVRSLGQIVVQLIRNSLAHGQESESSRIAAHKNPAMRVHIGLLQDADSLVLNFSDDGSGIDPARIAGETKEMGVSFPTDADILAVISRAGFSTRDNVQKGAGRGMGLNLVDHQICTVLRGSWKLENRPGKGVSFIFRFPAKLFSVSVLVCETGNGFVAVPQALVEGVRSISPESVFSESDATLFVRLGGRKMPLSNQDLVLKETSTSLSAIVVNSGNQNYEVLAVKKVVGEEIFLLEPGAEAAYSSLLSQKVPVYSLKF